jgi:O-antigen ligase
VALNPGKINPASWDSLLWKFLLISIPFTSFPLIAILTNRSTVSALAGLPLAFLMVFWFLPYLWKKGRLPRISVPLLAFFVLACFTSFLFPFREIYPFLNQSVLGRTSRGLLTLVIGISFYLLAAVFPRSERDLRSSLRWLYFGAVITFLWAFVQAFFVIRDVPVPQLFGRIHNFFSIRYFHQQRVTGFAYEPSGLANQIVILYIPLLLSSVVTGYSAFKTKTRHLSIELLLVAAGAVVLFLTTSRIGLISGFAVLGVVALWIGWKLTGRWAQALVTNRGVIQKRLGLRAGWLHRILWILFILSILLGMIVLVILAGRIDSRFARIFETDYSDLLRSSDPVYSIAQRLAYAERLGYWTVGLRVFSRYPILGVGVGNAGFFFGKDLPAYGYRLPELIHVLTGVAQFPNPKNLWIRLLAETGIVGFLTIMAWFFVLIATSVTLMRRGKGILRMMGMASSLSLLAQFFEGFSLDSFALPQLWIMLGFQAVALFLFQNSGDKSHRYAQKEA